MEYLGFLMLMIGVAGIDSNTVVAGLIAVAGLLMIAVRSKMSR